MGERERSERKRGVKKERIDEKKKKKKKKRNTIQKHTHTFHLEQVVVIFSDSKSHSNCGPKKQQQNFCT